MSRQHWYALLLGSTLPGAAVQAADGVEGGANVATLLTFIGFVALTLGITWWAARLSKSREAFFVAGGTLAPWKNGLAIAGDFMSAATFLGITGALYFTGVDAFVMAVGIMIGWPIMLMVVAERFRNLGRFTFIDVLCYRLERRPIRIVGAVVSLCIVIFYLIAQMVGAGALIQLLFGFDYKLAAVIVGLLMIVYVAFGGMLATTWVQLVKAVLLLVGGTYLAWLVLAEVDFSITRVVSQAARSSASGDAILSPGLWLGRDPFSVLTTGMTMVFGIIGLPHVLMRFFTVKSAADARQSVFVATSAMGYFYLLIFVIGFGAVAVLTGNPLYADADGALIGGSNMVAIHLSHAMGGDWLQGFMAAICFATILAVVAGLTLSGAATIAHDLYANLGIGKNSSEREHFVVARLATVVIGVLAIGLSIAFEGQNVAFIAVFALSVSASVNCPLIILSMYWRSLTTRGAVAGAVTSLALSMILVVLSPAVMVQVLGYENALFPYSYPTFIAMPAAFIVTVIVSKLDRSQRARDERQAFEQQYLQSELGDARP